MSKTVDERIVQMKFDNKHFEDNVQTSIKSLDKLEKRLDFDGAEKGMSTISKGIEAVSVKFSALQIFAVTALHDIANSAWNAGKRIVSALTIDPIKTGFQEYETQINAVQTILANTSSKGKTLEDVNGALDELNQYADKTIYNFTEMTRNIGTFTAAGVDLDTSVSAIKGIANLAAVSGSTSQQASTAMYQLSQALASGTVKLMDWNSVVNAGMGGQVFQDALKDTAKVHGVAIDDLIEQEGSFRETLQSGWLTSEILTETLSKFTGDLNEEQLKTMGYTDEQIESIIKMGQTANDAATKVKTFTQLFDTLKEAAQSGWTQSWEIIVGDFEEAKKLLTEVSDTFGKMIGDSAESRNNLLKGWKELGGRDSVIEGVRNAFKGVASVLNPLKEAFRDIFPPTTVQQLVNLTKNFENFTAKLTLSDEQSDKLRRTFKGLFAVIDIILMAFGALWDGAKELISGFAGVGSSVLDTTASFGDWLSNLRYTIKETEIFNKVIHEVVEFITTAVKGAIKILRNIVDAVKEFAKVISDKFDLPGFDEIKEKMEKIGETAGGMKDAIQNAFEALGSFLEKSVFVKILTGIFKLVTTVAGAIIKVFNKAIFTLADGLANADFDTILNFISTILAGGIAVSIKKFFDSLTNPLKDIGEVVSKVGGILDSVRGVFEAYQTKLQADTLMKIATAIGILTASILVISLINSEKLSASLGAITVLFAELMGSFAVFTRIAGNQKGTMKAVIMMLGISTAVLILASALKKVSAIGPEDLATGVAGVAALSAVVVASAKSMSSDNEKIMKGATGLVLFAAAIKILASAVEDMSTLDFGSMVKGLLGVGVLMASVAVFSKLVESSGLGVGSGLGIILLATAMKILASAVNDFGQMDLLTLGKGLTSLAAGLVVISVAMNALPSGMLTKGIGLIAVATAIKILASAVSGMGSMTLPELGKGLLGLGGSLAILAVGLHAMSGTLGGSASLVIAATAIAILTPALAILGNLDLSTILKGLGAIAGVFVILGVAGYALAPVVGVILALSAAFVLISVGVVALGAGLVSVAAGFTALATSVSVSGTVIVASLGPILAGIIKLIPDVITALVKGVSAILLAVVSLIPDILECVGTIISAIVKLLIECVPDLVEAIFVLISSVLKTLDEHTPTIIKRALSILVSILEGIADALPDVVSAAVDVVISFIDGIASKLPDIIDAGFNLVISFINGIADSIEKNAPLVIDAVLNLLGAVVKTIFGFVGKIKDAAKDLINGFIQGIKDMVKKAVEAVKDFGNSILKGLKNILGINSPSREARELANYTGEGFIIGLKDYNSKVKKSSEALGEEAISGMSNAISQIGDAVDENMNYDPVIRPVVDLSDVNSKSAQLYSAFGNGASIDLSASGNMASRAYQRSSVNDANDVETGRHGATYNFTQINNSPKSLDNDEIYRQTRNQFAAMKEMVGA